MSYLNEAFKELDELEDEVDLQSDEDVKQAIDFLNGDIDNTDHLEMVVDIDADEEEDLQDSYVGEILLMCPACHTLHYAHEEDIVPSEEEPDFVNVGEPCPHCKQENGFEIKGKVAEYVPGGEEPKEEETEDDILDIDDVEDEETEEEKAQFEESYRLRKQYVKDVAEDNLEDLARLTGIDLPTTKRVTESKTKSLKENLTEAPLYDLKPQYDARQSFYNKATVDTGDKGDKNKLYSYNTLVAEIKDGKPVVYGTYSQTTLRHIKEWLKQNGFKAENAKQILADYGAKRESCKEAVTKQDDIDAQADNKKELAKQEFEKKIDDADADRDDKLEEAKSNIVESAHRITINDDKITIDDDTYDLLDSNDEYYLFKDKNGVQEIRKDGRFDDERFFGDSDVEEGLVRVKYDDAWHVVDEDTDEEVDGPFNTLKDTEEAGYGNLEYVAPRTDEAVEKPIKKAPEITDEQKACKDEECKKKELDESLLVTADFDDYKPWSGAVDTYERLEEEGKLGAFEDLLEELYPEGISMVGINDILWFDWEWVFESLGITDEEEEDEDEEEVVEEDEFEESLFENLVNRYCSRVYENVDNYKATSCSRDKGEFIVEGMLTYKNGTQEPTKFTFTEGKTNTATKKYVGINETFSNNKKAFTLNVTKEGNKLLSESLYYNYTANVDNKDYPIKGKVTTPKRK